MLLSEKKSIVKEIVDRLFNESFLISYDTLRSIDELGYVFEWDTRSKRRLGCCKYTLKVITLSTSYVDLNFDKLHLIEDTIRHEMAHAFSEYVYGRKGCGHNGYWRSMCRITGAKPERCKDSSKLKSKGKYRLECPNNSCDNHKLYYRKPKVNKACGTCCDNHNNGRYTEKYKMVLKLNDE